MVMRRAYEDWIVIGLCELTSQFLYACTPLPTILFCLGKGWFTLPVNSYCFKFRSYMTTFFYPHFYYLHTVQMQVHLTNGEMGVEAGRGVPISTPL
jgi:hypothetical protein